MLNLFKVKRKTSKRWRDMSVLLTLNKFQMLF